MIELKDVIHYYIGCNVLVDGKEIAKFNGGTFVPNSVGQIYYDLQTKDMLEDDPDFNMPYNDDPEMKPLRIKPILRRIEDMTDEEGKEYNKALMTMYSINKFKDQIWEAAATTLLLAKKGFDLFGLIETDQAIDAKTINNG